MTRKEDAISLVYQYKNLELDFSRHQYESRFLFMEEADAIECAKIAVDRIINEITKIEEDHSYGFGSDYWIEVKQELEKL
jgi:hypothetical protein